ncbi:MULTISPECIES: NUDIX hydrolase [Maribacter]|nr:MULTISPECIES: NUDIX domain-containing protein [Maribacter]MBU2901153.1 NUDIX domain-containing protein [Maribacter dokdonensis]MDP2526356.1 NUDIX domain-containing protein [Maribacter dokdonensis]CAG2533982.1 ADP-ribose pyrophosphatase YjhB [Maribacter dokdonensis]HAF78491.1 NUDIX hydrolase [Maribacter sp.]|tara:strand:+ start:100515 stop:101216 length:702 start_codon:yes stop_codon:yes gene_type:complete
MKGANNTNYIPNLSYDCVIFGFNGKSLKILILEYHNTGFFALPGGFIRKNQSLKEAVQQGVKERTGLTNVYLDQFQVFGEVDRADSYAMSRILDGSNKNTPENQWMMDRFLTVGHYALINYEEVDPKPDHLSDSIGWYAIDDVPKLMMDHNEIVDKALEVLRNNISEKLIGLNLLPQKFTMKQLQQVFEAILDQKLRRTSFQRKMLSLDILERHEKLFEGKAHKAPYLYSFKQ